MGRALGGLWHLACRAPLALPALYLALTCLPALWSRPLWYSDEVRYGDVYRNLVDGGHWWLLNLNGQVYPDKPPVFFWLAWALDGIPGIGAPANLFLATTVSALAFLLATDVLGRTLGTTREARAATQLILVSTVFVALLFHYVRMDLLFATLILLSLAALHAHFIQRAPLWIGMAGFALAGLAVLTKGPLGALFPLAVIAVFLVWRGEARALASRAFLAGLGVAAGVVAVWLAGLVAIAGADYLIERIFGQQILGRARDAYRHKEDWYYYLVILPVAFLPWTAALIGLPARRILSADWVRARREAGPLAFVVVAALTMFAILTALSGKSEVYVLPMLPLLAMLTAEALLHGPRRRAVIVAAGVLMAVVGVGLVVVAVATGALPVAGPLAGAVPMLAAAALAVLLRDDRPAALAGLAILSALWIVAQVFVTLPSLSDRLSTRDEAELMATHVAEGHRPIAYRTYSGVFGFYLGRDLLEVADEAALRAALADPTPIVLVLEERTWPEVEGLLDGFTVVERARNDVAGGTFVIAVRN